MNSFAPTTSPGWPGDAGGLGRVFDTGFDILDAVGNGYAQLRFLKLQENLINAQARQNALLATPAVESQPGAQPAPIYVSAPAAGSPAGGVDATILVVVGVAGLAALLLLR